MSISSWFSQMIGTAMFLDNLDTVLLMQLRDLYSAEQQLIEALPQMADAAYSQELKRAFRSHLKETKAQAKRLERIFKILKQEPGNENCDAMEGLIAEGSEIIHLDGEPTVKDIALIAAAQRVEHYEIAGYGCARAFARRLHLATVANLLQQTIEEEGNADKLLTRITENYDMAMPSQPKDVAATGAHSKTAATKSVRVRGPRKAPLKSRV